MWSPLTAIMTVRSSRICRKISFRLARPAGLDITYVALPTRFVYLAVILDAWSRLIVGYAIGRSIDERLTAAALRAAIDRRKPPPGCIHHSEAPNTPPNSTGSFFIPTGSSVLWAAGEILMITPRPKAS